MGSSYLIISQTVKDTEYIAIVNMLPFDWQICILPWTVLKAMVKVTHILTVDISQSVTDMANIAIANNYQVTYGLLISVLEKLCPFCTRVKLVKPPTELNKTFIILKISKITHYFWKSWNSRKIKFFTDNGQTRGKWHSRIRFFPVHKVTDLWE